MARGREPRLRTAARRSSIRGSWTGTRYGDLVDGLAGFFAGQPAFGPDRRRPRHAAAQPRGRLPALAAGPARVHPAQVRRAARRPAARAAHRPRPAARGGEARLPRLRPRPRGRADLRRRPRRGRSLQRRPGLDAPGGDDREEHAGLARPALPHVRPAHRPARPGPRRGAGHPRPTRIHGPVADRGVGAQPRLAGHQAAHGESRGRGLGLRAGRLRGGRRRWAARRRWPNLRDRAWRAGHPPRERHGAQPHGHRFPVGDRAPRAVPRLAARRPALPLVLLHGPGPLERPARRRVHRGPLLGPHRRGRRLQAAWTGPRATSATCTTATTARTCRGTTRPSSTSSAPTPARRSSGPSCTWPACSRSSASTRP